MMVVGQTLSGLATGLATGARLSNEDIASNARWRHEKTYGHPVCSPSCTGSSGPAPVALDETGLVPALRWYARHYGEKLPISVSVEVSGEQRRLPPETEIILFRIAQEGH